MFSTRTTRGAATIVLADALISYLLFGITLSILSVMTDLPGWLNFANLQGNAVFLLFSQAVVISLAFNQLYFSFECSIRIELVKKILSAF